MPDRRFEKRLAARFARLDAEDPVAVVLDESLRSRFAAVRHFLPRAAERDEQSVEAVHNLRVWTRRAMAVLRLYRPVLPARRSHRLQRRLQQIRRAASAARDADVLIARHETHSPGPQADRFLVRLRQQRREAQPEIVRVCERLQGGRRLKRKVKKLRASAAKRAARETAGLTFAEWARQPLQRLVRRFAEAAEAVRLQDGGCLEDRVASGRESIRTDPAGAAEAVCLRDGGCLEDRVASGRESIRTDPAGADPTDVNSWHQFRIRGKQLRYGIELLAPAFPERLLQSIGRELRELQDRLGELNDRTVAVARLTEWIAVEANPDDRAHLAELLEQERSQQSQAARNFESWWTAGRSRQLQKRLEQLVATTSGGTDNPFGG